MADTRTGSHSHSKLTVEFPLCRRVKMAFVPIFLCLLAIVRQALLLSALCRASLVCPDFDLTDKWLKWLLLTSAYRKSHMNNEHSITKCIRKLTVSTPTKNKSKAKTAAIFGFPVFCMMRSIIERFSSSLTVVLLFIFSIAILMCFMQSL